MSSCDDSDTDEEIICQILQESRISCEKSLKPSTLSGGSSTSYNGELIGDKKDVETITKTGSWRKQKPTSNKKLKNKKKKEKKKNKMRNKSQSCKNADSIVEEKTDSSSPRVETSEPFFEEMTSVVPWSKSSQPSTSYNGKLIKDKKDVGTVAKTKAWRKRKPKSGKNSRDKMRNNSGSSIPFFEEMTSIVSYVYFEMTYRLIDPPIDELIKRQLERSLLFHTRYFRMDVVHVVLALCKIIKGDWKVIRERTLNHRTQLSWKIVENFMEKYYDPEKIVHHYPWFNFHHQDSFRQYHYCNNTVLCDLLAEISVALTDGRFKPSWHDNF